MNADIETVLVATAQRLADNRDMADRTAAINRRALRILYDTYGRDDRELAERLAVAARRSVAGLQTSTASLPQPELELEARRLAMLRSDPVPPTTSARRWLRWWQRWPRHARSS